MNRKNERNAQDGQGEGLSGQRVCVLLLLGLSLALIRHNGLVYLIILPMMIVALRLVSMRKTLITVAVLLLVAGIGIGFGGSLVHRNIPGTHFLRNEIQRYVTGTSVQNIMRNSKRMGNDYLGVLNINQTKLGWDKFHYFLYDRYAWRFLIHSGWWDLYPYIKQSVTTEGKLIHSGIRERATEIYTSSYQEPWVWLSWNPIWLLGLLPLLVALFWWFPYTAIFGTVLLAGALPLVFFQIFNWRYYYFLYLGLLFLLPIAGLDLSTKQCLHKIN
jgi:hypothetical protein